MVQDFYTGQAPPPDRVNRGEVLNALEAVAKTPARLTQDQRLPAPSPMGRTA